MTKKFCSIAFCFLLLTSCQSNNSPDVSIKDVSTIDTPVEISETETITENDPIETETKQTEVLTELPTEPVIKRTVEVGEERTPLYSAMTDPEKSQIVLESMSIDIKDPKSIQLDIHANAIEHIGYDFIVPVTPLFEIDARGHFFSEPVVLSYPHDEEDTSNYYAFFYDSENDTIEMLPFIRKATQTQFYTNHFSNIFIAQMTPEMSQHFQERKDVVTPFQVGSDDFSFVNNGSYAAPNGHCDGQSQAAMWYFKNIRLKNMDDPSTALHQLYDNNLNDFRTPNFWYDDSWLYRFASSVQKDERSGYIFGLLHLDTDIYTEDVDQNDQYVFDAFYLSMLLANRPQLIWIWNNDASTGHALIAYAIKGNRLYVADPNYPGAERYIEFVDGAFKPYGSGANFKEIEARGETTYTEFQFLGEFATIDEHQIETRWREVTSGQLSNEYFPYFAVISETGNVCIQRYKFKIEPIDNTPDEFQFTLFSPSMEKYNLTDATGTEVLSPPFEMINLEPITYVLEEINEGDNTIGVLIEGKKGLGSTYDWAGFQWLQIYNDTDLLLQADKTSVKPGDTVTLTAKMDSGIDISNQLEWVVEGDVKSYNTTEYEFSSSEIGTYTIEAVLLDSNLRKQILIEVTEDPLEPVQEIPESEATKVSGTYSCTFLLSSYLTEPYTNFQDDPWYTAEQKVQMAKESAASLQEAFSERVGIQNVDRNNFRVTVHDDGTCSIGFSDFLGFNMAFYSVGPVPFNGGNTSFDITHEGKQFIGIIQFELIDDGVEMWGRVKKLSRDNQYNCYITATYEFEGYKGE